MSLPACQQRVLDTIENVLQQREPRLAGMFAMFTRLSTNEGLPRTERLEAAQWWARRRHWLPRPTGRPARARGPGGQPSPPLRPLLLISVLIMLVTSIVFLGMASSSPVCTPTVSPHGLVTSLSHAKNCPSATGSWSVSHGP